MFVSLDKGNDAEGVTLAEISAGMILLKQRDVSRIKKLGYVPLHDEELLTLCKRAIKKGCFRKEDL